MEYVLADGTEPRQDRIGIMPPRASLNPVTLPATMLESGGNSGVCALVPGRAVMVAGLCAWFPVRRPAWTGAGGARERPGSPGAAALMSAGLAAGPGSGLLCCLPGGGVG